jgi:hypothetical protein
MTIGFTDAEPTPKPKRRRPSSVRPDRLAAWEYAADRLSPLHPTPTDVLQLASFFTEPEEEPDDPEPDEPEEDEEEPDSIDIAVALVVELIDRWPPVRLVRRFLS